MKSKFIVVGLIFIACVMVLALVYSQRPNGKSNADATIDDIMTLEFRDERSSKEQKELVQQGFTYYKNLLKSTLTNKKATNRSINALIGLAQLHRDFGDIDEARSSFQRAYDLSPNNALVAGSLGQVYAQYYHEYDRAVPYYLTAISTHNPSLETFYGELYEIYRYQLNDPDRAEQLLIDGVDKYPYATNIIVILAEYYRETGQKDLAIARYRELLKINPQSEVGQRMLKELGNNE